MTTTPVNTRTSRPLDKPLILWRLRELDVTATQLASYIGVSPAQLSRALSGTRHLKPRELKLLAFALGMDEELLYRDRLAA